MKILIVEDEEMIREGISDYLTDCGYETIEAADGQEALEQFSSYEVALVLLDIQMPKLNGLEVLAEIRKTSQVPVLMLTAFQDEEYKMSAFASLADGYLEKPFSLSLLLSEKFYLLKHFLRGIFLRLIVYLTYIKILCKHLCQKSEGQDQIFSLPNNQQVFEDCQMLALIYLLHNQLLYF